MPDPMPGMVINYRHLLQSTKPFDSIFVIGILEHHIILKDRTVTIAKLMQCFPFHFFSNLCVETSRFYIRMTKPFRYSRERHPRLIQVHCPRLLKRCECRWTRSGLLLRTSVSHPASIRLTLSLDILFLRPFRKE